MVLCLWAEGHSIIAVGMIVHCPYFAPSQGRVLLGQGRKTHGEVLSGSVARIGSRSASRRNYYYHYSFSGPRGATTIAFYLSDKVQNIG